VGSTASAGTAVSSANSSVPEGGFPTYADTVWGDPIAAGQHEASLSKRKSKNKGGEGDKGASTDNVETERTGGSANGKRNQGLSKRRGGKAKFATAAKKNAEIQEDSLSVALGVELAPGGPGSSWGDPSVEW
jgi:hypothetical protein